MKNDISIYIHIPFCKAKCGYCDFKSFAGMESYAREYKNALIREIELFNSNENAFSRFKSVKSIFIGGGTPSVIKGSYIAEILDSVNSNFNVASDAEISIEINPGTVDGNKLKDYSFCGINRVSIGMQAWQDRLLSSLGRIHNNSDFLHCYDMVRKNNFDNVNIDIMFALPGQTFDDWCETVENTVSLKPEHISAYSLIIEEGTPFFDLYEQGKLKTADDDLDRKMYYYVCDYAEKTGYGQYEISNFALSGRECRHNIVYWRRGTYKGFGLAAASLIDDVRYKNTDSLAQYINGNYEDTDSRETLSERDCMAEFMFLGLRCTAGIREDDFYRCFNRTIDSVYGEQIKKFVSQGLIKRENGSLCLTRYGIDISNIVFCDFL